VEDGALVAEVLWVDRFGNAQLNVGPEELEPFGPRVVLRLGDQVRVARRARTYDELGPGEVGLVIDSYGLVSLAMSRAPAAEFLGLGPGSGVFLAAPD
jgi:S-adenosylmethionine hydrolase